MKFLNALLHQFMIHEANQSSASDTIPFTRASNYYPVAAAELTASPPKTTPLMFRAPNYQRIYISHTQAKAAPKMMIA